jgi:DNA-directed RNA polymerase specialized sigma24 family protein
MAPTGRQLVTRAREGDQEAFGALVDRYRDMVYGFAYHLTRDFEAARDLAQEAFVQAYLKLGQLRDPDRFPAWLRRIIAKLHRNLHVLLAVAAAHLGCPDDAVAHLQEAATPGPERPGSERWFWPYREPAADPLEEVRAHPSESLGAVADDPRAQAILGA